MSVADMLAGSARDIGELDDVGARAELLVGLAHQCRDRSVWGGDRALTYWSRLPEKIRMATYAGPSLAAWWERCCRVLGCAQPHDPGDRADLARTLAGGEDAAVLAVLRTQTEALCLRVRLAVQLDRETRFGAAPPKTGLTDLDALALEGM